MTSRVPLLLCLLLTALIAGGCADSNSGAPEVDQAHPTGWVIGHAAEARDNQTRCQFCHGADFRGNKEAVSCFSCHLEGPPQVAQFHIHPISWTSGTTVIAAHQNFPRNFSWTQCGNAACHGPTLHGGIAGPSCFLAACHAGGPPAPAFHTNLFIQPQNHGALAKNEQIFCRNCHGRPPFFFDGGYVADPAIGNHPPGNCSLAFCHPAAMAHPTNWQGTDDTDSDGYLATHRTIIPSAVPGGCVLCHQTSPGGASPLPAAPSCFTGQFTNAAGNTTGCHPGGPSILTP